MENHRRCMLLISLAITGFLSTQLITSISHSQEKSISAIDAARHIGEVQTVCGMVAGTKFYTRGKGKPTFINLDQPYPNQIFTILIWGSDRGKFPEPPEDLYMGKKICVKGMIKEYRGKPEIIVNDPAQIIIVSSK